MFQKINENRIAEFVNTFLVKIALVNCIAADYLCFIIKINFVINLLYILINYLLKKLFDQNLITIKSIIIWFNII